MIRIIQKKTILPLVFAVVAVIAVSFLFSSCSKEETYRLVKINSYDGEVSVQREEKLNAFEGLQLVSNDTVSVGNKSFLELLADSDKHIAAEENTGFVLHSTGDENSGDITIDLLYGRSLFTIDNKLNEGSTFAVKTPNATLSVRGTSFSVAYDEETKTTDVEVYSGTVQLNSGDEEMLIEKNGKATVTTTENGVKIITNSTPGNPNAIAVPENTEKLFEIAMTYPQQEGYSAINAEYKVKASDYTAKEMGIGDNDIVFQKFIGLIKNHNSEISKFFEENKANAVANTNKLLDVTHWFKEKITVGDKEFRIDKAIMDMSIYGSNLEKKYVTSDTYKVNTEGIDMYFCANGVEISFYGGFEKAEVVTTTTATTTTTVPETTVPETTTAETTSTMTAVTTTAPVTTAKETAKQEIIAIPDGTDDYLKYYVSYLVGKDGIALNSKDAWAELYDPDVNSAYIEIDGERKYNYLRATREYYRVFSNNPNEATEKMWVYYNDPVHTKEENEAFAIEMIELMDVHADEMVAMYRNVEKNGFKTALENCTIKTEKNYGTGGDYIRRIYKKEFDATDWFPKTFTCEAGGVKYKYNIKKIVGNLGLTFTEVEDGTVSSEYSIVIKDPVTGKTVKIGDFGFEFDFYSTCKKIN